MLYQATCFCVVRYMIHPRKYMICESHDYGPTSTSALLSSEFPDAMLCGIPCLWIKQSINPWLMVRAKTC